MENIIIETYFKVFNNFKQNDQVNFFYRAKFIDNYAKNPNISHMFFEFNYKYNLWIFYKKNLDLCLKLKIIKKLFSKF